MKQKEFFIDTADNDQVKDIWNNLSGYIDRKNLIGITTNPNAMDKINANTLSEWIEAIRQLTDTLHDIRKDSFGLVYIQVPDSFIDPIYAAEFIQQVSEAIPECKSQIALKIPPYYRMLQAVGRRERNSLYLPDDANLRRYSLNVTGIADCATALAASLYEVRYISIIPGRMEEAGIDAKAHVLYTVQNKPDGCDIIAGSMRTVEGLRWTIEYGTVPTIGAKVWDKVFNEVGANGFAAMWDKRVNLPHKNFAPEITNSMTNLSLSFFASMDALGKKAYSDFLSNQKFK